MYLADAYIIFSLSRDALLDNFVNVQHGHVTLRICFPPSPNPPCFLYDAFPHWVSDAHHTNQLFSSLYYFLALRIYITLQGVSIHDPTGEPLAPRFDLFDHRVKSLLYPQGPLSLTAADVTS